MKTLLKVLALLICAIPQLHAVEQKADIINFQNNDTLHGQFLGYNDKGLIIWQTPESSEPIHFNVNKVRKVVFKSGLGAAKFSHANFLTLSNGDTLPCKLESLDNNQATISTDYAGKITIERKHIDSIDINPQGAKLLYSGPYSEDDWDRLSFSTPGNNNQQAEKKAWEFGNFSWYHNGGKGSIINRKIQLPKDYLLRFKYESSVYSNLNIILQGDFKTPKKPKPNPANPIHGQAQNSDITSHFGSCIAIRLNQGTPNLVYHHVADDGTFASTMLNPVAMNSISFENIKASEQWIEIRISNTKKSIAFYRNEKLVCQWNLKDLGKYKYGPGFGFSSPFDSNNILCRISDIGVAPWNYMSDPVISLQHEQRDIIMLTNGTDRFSGSVTGYSDNKLQFDGSYSSMTIPADEIQSFYFAKNKISTSTPADAKHIKFRFYGRGVLTAKTIGHDSDTIKINHPILGALNLQFKFLTSIDYSDTSSLLDDWNRKL